MTASVDSVNFSSSIGIMKGLPYLFFVGNIAQFTDSKSIYFVDS